MAASMILNLARVLMKNAKANKTYSTRQAAAKMRVSFRTLNRWLADGRIKPSTAIKLPNGPTLWLIRTFSPNRPHTRGLAALHG